jgi:DinB superfamily
MDARDLFLDQHSAMHSAAVAGNKASAAERAFAGLSDEQMRVRPREDLNSLAWLMWHIARAEDIIVNPVLAGRSQVFDDAWLRRLGIARRDFGIGMTSPEVSELTQQIDLAGLREYRDAVGRRTREVVGGFRVADWEGEVQAAALERAAAEGAFGARREGMVKAFTGRPRAMALSGIALPSRGASRRGGDRPQRRGVRHGSLTGPGNAVPWMRASERESSDPR